MDKKLKPKPLKKLLSTPSLLTVALLVIGFFLFNGQSGQGMVQKVPIKDVVIQEVEQGTFVNTLTLRGQVVPKTSIYLDTSTGGQVEERLVEQGAYVEKDQPLVRLSNTQLQLDVMGREAQVTEQLNFLRNTQMTMQTSRLNLRRELLDVERQIKHLKRRHQQTAELVENKMIATDTLAEITDDLLYFESRRTLTLERQQQEHTIRAVQLQQLEDSAEMLQNNLKFARDNLNRLVIQAPVAGYLSELDVEIGESKSAGARLGQIDIPNEYKVVLRLDEYYLNQVQLGMRVDAMVDGAIITSSISKIDSRVEQSQFSVEVDIPGNTLNVKRGQSIDADLMLGSSQENALLLARGAFSSQSGGHWVYVVDEGGTSARRRDIRLGKKNKQHYQVLSGLIAGERVITSSYSHFDQADELHF